MILLRNISSQRHEFKKIIIVGMSLYKKAESILKEFIENFEKIDFVLDKFHELKIKVAMLSIFKKNWEIYEKIYNIVIYNI